MKKISIYTIIISILLLCAGIAATTYGAIWVEKTTNYGPIISLIIGVIFLGIVACGLILKFYLKFKFKKMDSTEVKSIVDSSELDTQIALFIILNPIQSKKIGFK